MKSRQRLSLDEKGQECFRIFSKVGNRRIPDHPRALLVVLVLLFWGWAADCAAMGPIKSIGDHFSGEILKYSVGFWLIDPLGGGTADFRDLGHGIYMVFHEGKAEGIAGWLTRNRRETYRSTMRTINDGKRLIPMRFEEQSLVGEWFQKKTTIYDFENHRAIIELQKKGEPSIREELDIPLGVICDDPITAFYNFRFGVYGKVEPGKEFMVRTLPRRNEEFIRLNVALREEAETRRAGEKEKEGKDFLIQILVNREMWGRKKGEMEIWFNRDLLPIAGVVKDIPIFGDLKGRLTFHGFSFTPVGGNSLNQANGNARTQEK